MNQFFQTPVLIFGFAIAFVLVAILVVWLTFPFKVLALMREQNRLLKEISASNNKAPAAEAKPLSEFNQL